MKNYNKQDKILKGVELGLLAGVIGYTGKMVYDEYNQKNKMQKLASILRKIRF